MRRINLIGDPKHGQLRVIERCRPEFKKAGYAVEFNLKNVRSTDITIVHSESWDERYLDRNVGILERVDGPQLTTVGRDNIGHPSVRAILKHAKYWDRSLYGSRYWRRHEIMCRRAMGEKVEMHDHPPMPEDHFKKIAVVYSFANEISQSDKLLERSAKLDHAKYRNYTANFMGTTEYATIPWLTWHRKEAALTLDELAIKGVICTHSRSASRVEYWKLLEDTEVCISPWGCGETCWRDYEAVLLGCSVVKPDTSYVETTLPNFYSNRSFVVCQPDFSDLKLALQLAVLVPHVEREKLARHVRMADSRSEIVRRIIKALA